VTSPRVATWLRRATIVFVTVWAVRSLIVSGDALLHEHLRSVLTTSQWATQATSGDGFEQSLIRIRASVPASDKVLVVWANPPDYYYAYFWSTFWLFPRKVDVVSSLTPPQLGEADTVVSVRRAFERQPEFAGYRLATVDAFPDYIVTTYVRAG
jgi:hypothetical protein